MKAFILSQGMSVIGILCYGFLLLQANPKCSYFALPFFSFGIGNLFVLMISMTSDVTDLDELNTGKHREVTFDAIYWCMVKFGFAIAGGLSYVIISSVGFDSGAETQTEGVILRLRAFYLGFLIISSLIAINVMRNYDFTEARANQISMELAKRKNKSE